MARLCNWWAPSPSPANHSSFTARAALLPSVPTQWFQVGPEGISNGQTPGSQRTTGRITASVADPRDPNIIYIGTAGGGAWKTIDGGKTWRPLFDAIPEIQTHHRPYHRAVHAHLRRSDDRAASTPPPRPSRPTSRHALNALSTIGGAGAT